MIPPPPRTDVNDDHTRTAHILALQNRHARRCRDKAKRAQIAAEGRRSGTGRRILVHASHRERIPDVVEIIAVAPNEVHGRQLKLKHQGLQALELVVESSQPAPCRCRQYQVTRARKCDPRRQLRVQLIASPAKRSYRLVDSVVRGLLDVRLDAR